DHPDTRASRTTLADTYRQAGRHADAAPLYRDALTDALRDHGPYHPDTIRARRVLTDTTRQSDADKPPSPERPPTSETGYSRLGP
ncbi:tetratricopeptide repeat protein, partial [Frankia sp. CpI1-P]